MGDEGSEDRARDSLAGCAQFTAAASVMVCFTANSCEEELSWTSLSCRLYRMFTLAAADWLSIGKSVVFRIFFFLISLYP